MVEQQTLSLSLRPHKLSEIIGYEDVVSQIRNQLESGRLPTAWLFGGELGTGKTTLARIIAISLQCTHGKPGEPCDVCQEAFWDITEINASELNGVNEMKALVSRASIMPQAGRKKVFILDEAHRITDPAQNLLLKYFEDAHEHVTWIICTTNPGEILKPLRSRCLVYSVYGLTKAETNELVSLALKHVKSKLDPVALTNALATSQVHSPRLILMAVEKYVAGATADQAALTCEPTKADTLSICRAAAQGKWEEVAKLLKEAAPSDGRAIRVHVTGYFRAILVKCSGNSANIAASSIQELLKINVFEDGLQLSAIAAALFNVCEIVKGNKP